MTVARTVTVHTADHGPVTIPEPGWCLGRHPGGEDRVDITHLGAETGLTLDTARGPVTILCAALEQRPYSPDNTHPFLNIDLGHDWYPHTPGALHGLADQLAEYAGWLRIRAHHLAVIQEAHQ
ncbi:hypothetical protein [Streptomyces sp. PH10-H1]|uniref:DUF6907 domain-containing protein n=1 Tax=Streptomyces sp. PH10-H1 TaxID=3046212 RepID=UPI0024B89383|nr:hypothetical protein [Streptomyces sp. PH10-H1]MDJ0346746.1 hypothetical protein [Streptomyces sp. PH10-H1]